MTNPDDRDGAEPPPNLTQTVMRGVGLAGAGYAATQTLTLIAYLVLARLLVPEDFGVFAAATAIYGFALIITDSGMMAALIHRRDRLPEAIATATVATFAAGILFSLLALAMAPVVGYFFDSRQVTIVAAASSGLIFLRTVGCVPAAMLQRRFSFLRRLVVEPAQVLIFGITATVAATHDLGVWALVIGQYAGNATEAVLSWALFRTKVRLRLASIGMWRELASYGRHVLAASFVQQTGDQSDALIVGRFIGTAALGQFRYAIRIAALPLQLLLSAAAYVLFPAFARISDDRQRFRAAYLRSLTWVCVFAFPTSLALIPLGPPLAVLLFGETWRPAGEVAMAMSMYAAGASLTALAVEGLKAIGRPDALPRLNVVITLATAGGMLAAVPFGIVAIGAGLSFGAVVGATYSLLLSRRYMELPFGETLSRIWPCALAAALMAGAVLPLELAVFEAASRSTLPGLGLIALEASICAVLYLSLLTIFAPKTGRVLLTGGLSLVTSATSLTPGGGRLRR